MNGFLGTRASLMLDVVVLAMAAIVPIMAVSIYQVKFRRRYLLHKQIQLALSIILPVAIVAFEIDMRFFSDWKQQARVSPYYATNWVWYSLWIHLFFALPTPFVWCYVIVQALRKFPVPPAPGQHSPKHIVWAWLAAAEMLMTAVTGWLFYWLAFVAQ